MLGRSLTGTRSTGRGKKQKPRNGEEEVSLSQCRKDWRSWPHRGLGGLAMAQWKLVGFDGRHHPGVYRSKPRVVLR